MSDFIELHDWACWKFGPFEYRICGYNSKDGGVRCIITEPILGVNIENQFVETTNHLKFKLDNPIEKNNMIDMMYILDRWMSVNVKGKPGEATEMVLEALGRGVDGKKVERPEDEPREEKPTKTDKARKNTKKSTKEEKVI